MSEIQTLQAKAIQAERLARTQTDPVISARLLALAIEYKKRLHDLDSGLH